ILDRYGQPLLILFSKGFRVSFPCTGKKAGVVLLFINIAFSDKTGRNLWGPLSLALRRRCTARPNPNYSSQSTSATTQVVPNTCNKRCSKDYIMKRFCLSDYVIRAKVESEVRKNGRLQLRVRVTKKYKKGIVKITRRQLLELRGRELTCDCSPVILKRHYLLLGKEDKKKRVLYVDNLLIALDWETSGKKMLRMHRKRRYRCPKRIAATGT
ncbi:uncharacterized protein LOC116303230, partial [Actinia tenebrosa]|uniref:Uncharacterized protein LOC116303230 n=1 Tax=Actinia tenebrosa TaxID=6105 RepID=A0A6P8ING8_ACTTE